MVGVMGHAGPQGVCGVVIVRVCNRSGFLVSFFDIRYNHR